MLEFFKVFGCLSIFIIATFFRDSVSYTWILFVFVFFQGEMNENLMKMLQNQKETHEKDLKEYVNV